MGLQASALYCFESYCLEGCNGFKAVAIGIMVGVFYIPIIAIFLFIALRVINDVGIGIVTLVRKWFKSEEPPTQ